MKKSSCESPLAMYTEIIELEDLRSTYIANCVLNVFLSYTAIMLNIVTIHVIRKTSSLPQTLKTLLLSLAVADVGVGLLVQPFYTSLLVKWLQGNSPSCNTLLTFRIISLLFSCASFFGVVAISVDRFLAIHLHLRYQELVTHKRVVAVVISVWVMSAIYGLLLLWIPRIVFSFTSFIILVLGIVLTTLVYIRICFTARRHKNQIQAQQVQQVAQTGEMENFGNLVKSAVGISYVYLAFLVCYLPYFISLAVSFNGPSVALMRYHFFSHTFFYLNSSLNPVIYCWKMRHIQHAIMDTLRNMSWLRSSASH